MPFAASAMVGDLGLGLDVGVVRLLGGLRARNGDVALRVRAGDRGVLRDLRDVVDAEVLDGLVVVREVLDVERDDLEAHPREVGVRIGLHHVRELLAVEHHLLRVHLADDLSHVALEHLLRDAGYVVRRGVEEVHRREVDLLRIAPDLDVHHCVDVNVDEVGVRHGLGRLDVDLDELERDLVEALEERYPEVRAADDRPALEPGDYVRHVRRGLYVGHDEKQDGEKDRRRDEYCLQTY